LYFRQDFIEIAAADRITAVKYLMGRFRRRQDDKFPLTPKAHRYFGKRVLMIR